MVSRRLIFSAAGYGDSAVFVLNCFAVIPLADVLCRATDDAASFLGETAGALLNVTMGNTTELAIFHALLQRQYTIVRTSLLGSIIVNMLFVLGLSILVGETQMRGQSYNIFATRVAAGLLCFTTVSLLLPSTIKTSPEPALQKRDILALSRGTSIVLIVVYFIYLWTQMKSRKFSYKPLTEHDEGLIDPEKEESIELSGGSSVPWVRKAIPVVLILLSTCLISISGELLVSSTDHFVDHSPISKTMVGLIILPIVGNAAELISGIMLAYRKQMDLAFAVCIGSAIQMALFVAPLVVLLGWGMGREMSLHFSMFEAITLVASTVLFFTLVFDDRCSGLKGAFLLAGYTIISLASYFIPDTEHRSSFT
ncbi:Ca2+ transporter [Bimuria novae-zelandiae CBS 107.79]|uniref:Vacuolar calcium ion transporter n=1 Tax=Bimuria novae-zelandiae CBS 107.79 TaxID=1447943 RepID=A0A6A5UQ02_9PLEO|nr:Ca2+ transporter [Bimuria novae-zelandiae CBS 107.79]